MATVVGEPIPNVDSYEQGIHLSDHTYNQILNTFEILQVIE